MIHLKSILNWALLTSVLFFISQSYAQNGPIKLIFAERVSDYKGQINTTKAVGNVQFQHNNTRLFCDSAIFLQTPSLIYAYGHVQINQGDTVNLFCDSLLYNGKTNISKLWGNVRFRDNEYKLVTDSLYYNANLSKGYYQNKAVITSISEDLKLTSTRGYYFSNSKIFFFKDSVHVTHPDYELFSDTLEFRTKESSALFHGPTKIIMDSTTMFCNKGIYYTDDKFIQLWDGATIIEPNRLFNADSLVYNQATDVGEGFCNITMYDSLERVLFLSDYLHKNKRNTELLLRDNAHIIQFSDNDTLFLSADTIMYFNDTILDMSTSIALSKVEIINKQIMVACDSAYFSETDSIIKFHKAPLMWNNNTQLSGDSIIAIYYDKKFHQLTIQENAFMASKQDSIHFDQVKGNNMIAFMSDSKLKQIQINDNAQTMYYVSETKIDSLGNESKDIDGLNQIDCNYIMIYFYQPDSSKNEIKSVSFNEEPEGTYTPVEEVSQSQFFMKGFNWEIDRKPRPILLE